MTIREIVARAMEESFGKGITLGEAIDFVATALETQIAAPPELAMRIMEEQHAAVTEFQEAMREHLKKGAAGSPLDPRAAGALLRLSLVFMPVA